MLPIQRVPRVHGQRGTRGDSLGPAPKEPVEWCDYSGWVNDRFVGVLMMGHPENFSKPYWMAREFEFLSNRSWTMICHAIFYPMKEPLVLNSTWNALDDFRQTHSQGVKLVRHLASPFKVHPAIVIAILVMVVMKGPTGTVTSVWEQACSFAVTFLCDGSGLSQVFWSTAPLALSVTIFMTLLSLGIVKLDPFGLLVGAVITIAGAGVGNRCGGIFNDLASQKPLLEAPPSELALDTQAPAISTIQHVNLPQHIGVGASSVHALNADREKTLLPTPSLASASVTSTASSNSLTIHSNEYKPKRSVRVVVSPDLADRANQSKKLHTLLHQLEEVSLRLEKDAATPSDTTTNAKLLTMSTTRHTLSFAIIFSGMGRACPPRRS